MNTTRCRPSGRKAHGAARMLRHPSIKWQVFVAPLAVMLLLAIVALTSAVLLRSQGEAFREVVGESFDSATTVSRLSLKVAGIHSDVIRQIDLLRLEQNSDTLLEVRTSLPARFDEAESMLRNIETTTESVDPELVRHVGEFISIYRIVATRLTETGQFNPALVSSLMSHYSQLDGHIEELANETIKSAKDKQRRTDAFVAQSVRWLMAGTLVCLLLAGLLTWFIGRAISNPLTEMTAVMSRLAEGDYEVQIPAVDRHDEVGLMARAVEVFRRASMQLAHREAELARLVERLAATRDEAAAANRSKSAFLASMSHELRTPLNAILGYAQILQRDHSLGERQSAAIATIHNSGEHLLRLINDILDVSKIEAGKLDIYPGVVPLTGFFNEIGAIVGVKAEQKHLELTIDVAPELPAAVQADEKRLRQVLLNLLGNAVKFTEHGRIVLRVRRLDAPAGSARLRFEISDTGIGIGPQQLEAIFQPFEQAGDMRQRLGGTGLGLSISRQLLRLMGGDIEVRSMVGVGSTFSFELELPIASAGVAQVIAEPSIVGYEGARKKVLLVDDIIENRAVMRDLIGPLGFEVHEAAHGQEALALAPALRPDIILMDIVMPVMDGLEAIRRMRSTPVLAETPIIAISASVSKSDAERTRAAGADVFLSKPIVVDRLLSEMGRMLALTWIRQKPVAAVRTDAGPMVAPPKQEMGRLLELAKIGNMRDIRERAAAIAAQHEQYRPFADRLCALADGYQSKAILEMIHGYDTNR
jgi:signal transduction histidine kinase/DNA-binding NarL/FixJ family response regulator